MRIWRDIKKLLLISVVSFSFIQCKQDDTEGMYDTGLFLRTETITANEGSMFLTVDAKGEWTLSLEFDGGPVWAELGVVSGYGRRVDVDLYWEKNETGRNRELTICMIHENGLVRKTLTQRDVSFSDVPAKWMELPAVQLEGDRQFLYHDQIIAGESIRSWSYLWNPEHLVAQWVAYPLNKTLIGSGSRTDEWGLDPNLPRDRQPVLFSYYRGNYNRGHQIPSADRYNRAANIQTFYGTNMTPQNGRLNSGVWAALEGQVREWSYCFDTLYVVTGCVVEGSVNKAYDNDGKAVTVPSGYFKALLGYTRSGGLGITPQTGGYTGIGFYMKHFDYSTNYMDSAMTIDQLEQITGFDFFVNLPDNISSRLADYVESSKDSYWYN